MSLILDALKRAEQERNPPEAPPPSELTSPTALQSRQLPIKRWAIEAVFIFIIFGVGLFFYFQLNNDPSSTETISANDNSFNNEMPIPTENVLNDSSQVLVSHKKTTVAVSNTSNQAVHKLYQQQANNKNKTSANTKKKPSKKSNVKEPSAAINTNPGKDIFLNMPLLAQMPIRFRQAIPSIEYSVHVYSAKEGAGFVILNGKRRKIGDKLAPGLRVIKILKESVVLDYNGIQFRLLSLESWVNFG